MALMTPLAGQQAQTQRHRHREQTVDTGIENRLWTQAQGRKGQGRMN